MIKNLETGKQWQIPLDTNSIEDFFKQVEQTGTYDPSKLYSPMVCEAINVLRQYLKEENPLLVEIESLLEDIQKAVDKLVATYDKKYDSGSHIRCPECEWNGGIVIQKICKHCGKVEKI